MLVALRVAFYIQLLLGVTRFAGWLGNQRVWETHLSLGILIALFALFALRPHPRIGTDSIRSMARFAPIAPLLVGLLIFTGTSSTLITWLHMLLGIAALGLVEMAAGRQRRALSGGSAN